jgi:DNA-binding NtrC family response regulator
MAKESEVRKKIKILLVDDEVDFVESVGEWLGSRDFEVTIATRGEEAIKSAKKGGFDLALLDLKMPGMDGTEVLKTLKSKHRFLEAVILTGYASLDSAVECMRMGAFGYLEKPCDSEKLVEVLKDAYTSRLRKKFESDKKRADEIAILASGSSPMGILRALVRLDDEEK